MTQCSKQALFKDGGAFSSLIRLEGISWSCSTGGITISSKHTVSWCTHFFLWSVCCKKGTEKSPGPYCIPAELLKERGYLCIKAIHKFITLVWQQKNIPQHCKDANIVTISKNKGDRSICENTRGIALLSAAGKVLASTCQYYFWNLLPESQSGVRAGRSTVDMIFTHASWKSNVTNNIRTCSLLLWIFPRLLILKAL